MAALVAIGCLVFWFLQGAHQGWSRTSSLVKTIDPTTGRSKLSREHHFQPGLDFLAATVGPSLTLFTIAYSLGRRSSGNPS